MGQITNGIRSLLGSPHVYQLFSRCLTSRKSLIEYTKKYIRPLPNDTILDIGCGTANILNFLPPSIKYYGFDLNKNYIKYAQKKFNHQTLVCNDINNDIIHTLPKFDIILANAILHHLDDNEMDKLFAMARTGLKDSGRVITIDCCYIENQSNIAKFIISKDRGKNIRTVDEYKKAASRLFSNVKTTIRHDLLRVPYTHVIMECSNDRK